VAQPNQVFDEHFDAGTTLFCPIDEKRSDNHGMSALNPANPSDLRPWSPRIAIWTPAYVVAEPSKPISRISPERQEPLSTFLVTFNSLEACVPLTYRPSTPTAVLTAPNISHAAILTVTIARCPLQQHIN
jgi:hypothetical protein